MGLRQVLPVQTKSTRFFEDIGANMLLDADSVKSPLVDLDPDLANWCFKDRIRTVDGELYQIGRSLIDAREEAGLDVTDVMYLTKIPRSVVEALEAEDFSFFSSPTYAKSFLRQYSEFLKVDAEEWLNALEPGSYVGGQILGPLLDNDEPLAKEPAVPSSPNFGFSAIWLLLLSAGLVAGVLKGYQYLEQRLGSNEVSESKSTETPETEQKESDSESDLAAVEPASPDSTDPKEDANESDPEKTSTLISTPLPPRAIIVRE